jgi:hypothetical protein
MKVYWRVEVGLHYCRPRHWIEVSTTRPAALLPGHPLHRPPPPPAIHFVEDCVEHSAGLDTAQ